jgi:carbon-monoxide dehydrogenase small subunit
MFAVEFDGKDVLTIEGIGKKELDEIQKAFVDKNGIQCGFCTPGMIMSIKALLDKNSEPDEEEIKTALEGNLCRCTGYYKIIEAVKYLSGK